MTVKKLLIRSRPYLRLAKRVIRGAGTPSSVAFEKETLCPSEIQPVPLPVYIPHHLERVTAGTEHQSLKLELESMLASTYAHAPTIAYHLRNALISSGSVYADTMKHYVSDQALSPTREAKHIQSGALISSATGCKYFGHWLRDDCTQYLLSRELNTIAIGHELKSHQIEYARIFNQDWRPTDFAIVDHLVIFQDYAQNSLKRFRYDQLSRCIAQSFPETQRDKLIFLRRGQTGARRTIENEDELLEFLQRSNFEIVDVRSDLSTILHQLRRARLVVSMEGSQINHCLYSLTRGCALLVLEPPDRFTAVHRHWTSCREIHFGFVVGQQGTSGYRFSGVEILKLAEVLLGRC